MEEILDYLKNELEKHKGEKLYAIVDTGIHKGFAKTIQLQDDEKQSILFKGNWAVKLEEVAPYIIELDLEEDFTQGLIASSFGKYWLTLLVSTKSLTSLVDTLEEMIVVYSDLHKKRIIYRFYDERNLLNYLKIHNREEIVELFNDIEGFFITIDTKNSNTLYKYSYNDFKEKISLEKKV